MHEPCEKCGSTDRYPISNKCRPCDMERAKKRYHAKKNGTLTKSEQMIKAAENRAKRDDEDQKKREAALLPEWICKPGKFQQNQFSAN